MANWYLYKLVGGNWVEDGTIPAPNATFEETTISTQKKMALIDGSEGRIIPSTKYLKRPMRFVFKYNTATKTKIEAYIQNAIEIKISVHTGQLFTGIFVECRATWVAFGTEQKYSVVVTFDSYPVSGY